MVGLGIKRIRERKKITQQELASRLGVSRQAICMWEAGKRGLSLTTIHKIARTFNMSVDDIIQLQRRLQPKQKEDVVKSTTRVKAREASFELMAPAARQVALTGNFNSWNKSGISMKREKNGLWKVGVGLKPGRYEYRFIVDGQWVSDPANNKSVRNTFGTTNSIKEIA